MLQAGTSNEEKAASKKSENDRIKGIGLGFDDSSAKQNDSTLMAEISKMKKKSFQKAPDTDDKPKAKKSASNDLVKGSSAKKNSMSVGDQMIADRREKKQQRKEKQIIDAAKAKTKDEETTASKEEDKKPERVHFKKNTLKKTRSKQKNKKKDNRTEDDKRQKLAAKGITMTV